MGSDGFLCPIRLLSCMFCVCIYSDRGTSLNRCFIKFYMFFLWTKNPLIYFSLPFLSYPFHLPSSLLIRIYEMDGLVTFSFSLFFLFLAFLVIVCSFEIGEAGGGRQKVQQRERWENEKDQFFFINSKRNEYDRKMKWN